MAFNCACDDENPSRTLAELQSDLITGLGFVDILTTGPTRTLAQMRLSVETALALSGTVSDATRTLLQVRTEVYRMAGFAAMATPAPGINDLLNSFINEAQQTLFRRLEMDKAGSPPAWMSGDSDATTLDGIAVQMLAVALVKAHFGQADANIYREHSETYLANLAQRSPPYTAGQIDDALRRSRDLIWNRTPALPPMTADGDSSTIHYVPIELLTISMLKLRAGQKDAEIARRDYERYVTDADKRMPPDALGVARRSLIDAQAQLYRQYPVLRTERYFEWALIEGQRFYDVDGNDDECAKVLDPRMIRWVGISLGDYQWQPLVAGIPPESYQSADQQGIPFRYEIRQCIEVWPAPDTDEYKLRVKGDFGLEPFDTDSDQCTIDDTAVYLFALARSKAHFKQQDANVALQDATNYIRNLTAGTHQTRRYLPGEAVQPPWPRPIWIPKVYP